MNEQTTVSELRGEKKKELSDLAGEMERLEKKIKDTSHGPMEMYLGLHKELDAMRLRRRTLKDFLKELGGKKLLIRAEEVMHFGCKDGTNEME